ncbi:MAG: electron transport complex subunit E [Faecalibacterium prausnitzii]|nr:electron transport complex subunit E [Faecalibacterium prausnitzii]
MAQENKSKVSILTNGIIKENPVLRLVLGTCSILAVTTAVSSALGMGAAFTFVLVCSNIMISLLRKVIPGKVHLPCYIVIIAGFVTIVQMFMQAYMESLYNALGVFLPLIVVNCIILGRAEMFACKNSVVDSALDGVGMGIGFTLTLTAMASIREILSAGSWLGITIVPESIDRFTIMGSAPGGFFTFGFLMAMVILYENRTNNKIKRSIGCAGNAEEEA